MGAGRRMVVAGALCAAFAWGCEERQTPEPADRPLMQPPRMSAPDGEGSAASGETLRRERAAEQEQRNPAELPGAHETRGTGGGGEEGTRQGPPVDEACAAQQDGATEGTQPAQPAPQAPRDAEQQQPAQGEAQRGTGGAGPDQGNTGVSPEESRAVRDEATTIIVPGQGDGLDAATVQDAERAAEDARAGDSDGRIVIANVEFGGRLQEVGPERVVVRDAEGNLYEAQLEEASTLRRGGRDISAEQLREGMQVRASLDLVEGAYVVRELESNPQSRRGGGGAR